MVGGGVGVGDVEELEARESSMLADAAEDIAKQADSKPVKRMSMAREWFSKHDERLDSTLLSRMLNPLRTTSTIAKRLGTRASTRATMAVNLASSTESLSETS